MLFLGQRRVKWVLILIMVVSLFSCAGGGSNTDKASSETDKASIEKTAVVKIANYAKGSGAAPAIQDYVDAGVEGVDANNIQTLNKKIASLSYADVDTTAEIQAVLDDLEESSCTQVVTHAYNPTTNEERDFATPCDVPEGWIVGSSPVTRIYGVDGGNAIAAPIIESVNGNSVIIMPQGITAANPVSVVFFAPGWKNTDYTKYQTLLNFIASHGYAVIFAKDFSGMTADGMLTHFRDMVNNPAIKPLLDTSRIGVIGHSSGGGHTFRILRDFSNNEGWGENGRFLLALEPWFAFAMTESDMKSLPAKTRIVIQQYGQGGNNAANNTDPRIPLTEYYLLDSIENDHKDYQIVVNADHNYPKGNGAYAEMQGILKPLDGLMELTFQAAPAAGAKQAALALGNDDPYNGGHGIQVVNLIKEYNYKCHGANTIINYCKIYQGAFPPESVFNSIATNIEIAKPALKGKYIDREFGREVTRVTDRINQNDDPKVDANGNKISRANVHPYAKTQAWNSDMTMIRLGYRLYDADTLDEVSLKKKKSDGTYTVLTTETDSQSVLYSINGSLNEKKWSSVNPNVFYGVYNDKNGGTYNGNFWKGTINRAAQTIEYNLVKSFASNNYIFDRFTLGKYEGNIDFNDRYVAFAARKTGQKYLTAIVYDMQNNNVIKIKDFPDIAWPDQGQVFDWLTISPLGNYVLFSTGNVIYKYDKNLNLLGQLTATGGHGDLGVDINGAEVYVQYEYGAKAGIWIYRLSDGHHVRLLPDKYNGGHISCRNYKYQGWCYASTTAPGYKDIVAIKLDYTGPNNHIVRRFVQTQTSTIAQSNVNVSPNGKQVLFDSDWRDNTVHWTEKDTYIVK